MKSITCLIIEDEPNAVKLLESYISRVPFLTRLMSFYDPMAAMEWLRSNRAELIFLDINLPGINGMEFASLLPRDQKIIFTTAYAEYALESFSFRVLDYLLKPITFQRFMQAMQKLDLDTQPSEKNDAADQGFLFVKSGKKVFRIEYAAILYIEAVKEYIAIHTETEKILAYKRMKDVAAALPASFIRIHNSFIINLQHVRKTEQLSVQIRDQWLPVSNSYKDIFQEKINQWLL
jgi:two-component system LytT family response regulator